MHPQDKDCGERQNIAFTHRPDVTLLPAIHQPGDEIRSAGQLGGYARTCGHLRHVRPRGADANLGHQVGVPGLLPSPRRQQTLEGSVGSDGAQAIFAGVQTCWNAKQLPSLSSEISWTTCWCPRLPI